jgi:phenylpyruvate tautomerase PptA (4-oxalocrotonate tautomerase family)
MPWVDIRVQGPVDPEVVADLIEGTRERGAAAMGSGIENIWVTFQALPERYLARGGPGESRGPIVVIRANAGRPRAAKTALAQAVAGAIAERLRVPADRVWIHYQEMSPADVWTGGGWAQDKG